MWEHTPKAIPTCSCGYPAICHRPSHAPKEWPICTCGARAENHRVKHKYIPKGEFCECGLALEKHIGRGPSAKNIYRYQYVGIDGEGINRRPHKYVLMCAATDTGQKWMYEDTDGIQTTKAFDWILETLDKCRVFAYGFGYDISLIIRDMPDALIYDLFRPHRRYEKGKLKPIRWRGYSLNILQGKFTLEKGKRRVVIWDIQKFFQQTFVKSLKDWEIDTENIEEMKDVRSGFTLADMPKLREYCTTECRQLAHLAKKLLAAHTEAGFTLTQYYGPGSSASVMLSKMAVLDYTADPPEDMIEPVMCAFSGGRFEHSYIGIVDKVYSYDISSAYPYASYFLPCLAHGRWTYVKLPSARCLRSATTALVQYEYRGKKTDVWAPFPHRDYKGAITYPYRCKGWSWFPEYKEATRFGKVKAVAAWVYNTSCNCRPFEAIATYYRRRSELGKDAKGKVIKLAVNSASYGKLAQSKGPTPKYQNWIWAGLVTATCRSQILRAIQSAPSPSDIIGIATDGIFSRVRLCLPKPLDTGTYDLPKPLGGWEEKVEEKGMLFVKPGIYLSLDEKINTIKARGIGRRALTEDAPEMVAAWLMGAEEWTTRVDRFHGARTCITPIKRRKEFGQWTKFPIRTQFKCLNRREDLGLVAQDKPSSPYKLECNVELSLDTMVREDMQYEQPCSRLL